MDQLVAAIVLFFPGVIAAARHNHIRKKARNQTESFLILWAGYTLIIDWILCMFKLLDGRGEWDVADGFRTVKSFATYSLLAIALAFLLPYLLRRLSPVLLRWCGKLQKLLHPVKNEEDDTKRQVKNPSSTKDIEKKPPAPWWKRAFRLDTSLLKLAAVFGAVLAASSILLILVSAIPDANIDQNIRISSEEMSKEGKYPEVVPGREDYYYRVDNWTEAALLNMIYTGSSERPVEAAFAQKEYQPNEKGVSGVERLAAAVQDGSEENGSYALRSTYWLGVRIFLLPLLTVADYYTLRPFLLFFNLTLFFGMAILLAKKVNTKTGTAFFFSVLMLNCFVSVVQWCNGLPCFWIAAAVIIYVLCRFPQKINYCCLFLLVGALTSYFDWFSVPLITFGLPVIIVIVLEIQSKSDKTFLDYFNFLFQSGLGWCMGYGLMLVSRVVISTMVEGTGSFQNFWERVVYNITSSGNSAGGVGLGEKLMTILNGFTGIFPLSIWGQKFAGIVLAIGMTAVAFLAIRFCKKLPGLSALAVVSLAPFAWFILFNGYCRVHYWIAFRVFIITVFAWILIFALAIGYYRGRVNMQSDLQNGKEDEESNEAAPQRSSLP